MPGSLTPVGMTFAELADALLEMSERVRAGDSWEGYIHYALGDGTANVEVTAVYQVGNLTSGQGYMRIIGGMPGGQ